MAVRKPPQLNGTQTADMAFILVCFFMMVTTMGSEFGLIRQLPPWVEHTQNEKGDPINRRNVFIVAINQQNNMMVQDQYRDVSELRAMAKDFFDINNVGEKYPEKEVKNLPMIGNIHVNKTAIFSLQNDRGTSYKIYIQAQNELTAAVNELRDEFCIQRFGSKFDDCTLDQQDVVGKQIYPMAISEAEPKDVSKTKTKTKTN